MAPCNIRCDPSCLHNIKQQQKKMSSAWDQEDEQGDEMLYNSGENAYFLLDLKLPNLREDVQSPPASSTPPTTVKFGFVELLEKIHNKDLKCNNPWLNPAASKKPGFWRKRYKKQVRFATTEISSASLPHCRRTCKPGTRVSGGQLHAEHCSNSLNETVEVLGEHVWQNRVFILETCVKRPTSESDFYDLSQEYVEGEQYYKHNIRDDSIVFDSVELRKRQLSQEESVSSPETTHEPKQSTCGDSDNESLTSTSTVKLADMDQQISPAGFLNPPGPFSADSAFHSEDPVFEMYQTHLFPGGSGAYDSDYDSDSDEVDLTSLLEKVSAPSAPVHQLWFKADPPPPSSVVQPTEQQSTTTIVATTTTTQLVERHDYKPPWPSSQSNSNCTTVNISNSSVIGDLLAPVVSTDSELPAPSVQIDTDGQGRNGWT